MKVIIRLYRQHDLDLLTLKHTSKTFQKDVREALRSYVRKIDYRIDVNRDLSLQTWPKSSQCHISLHDEKDKDVILWLASISKGYRNSLIKNIVRSYLSRPIADNYFNRTPIKESRKTEDEIIEEIMSIELSGPQNVKELEAFDELLPKSK